MRLLVCYDVETTTREGRRRLRQMAKACESYGQRAQKSVFEITVDKTRLVLVENRLKRIINPETDSLRIYFLDEDSFKKTRVYGSNNLVDFESPLIV